MLTDDFLHPTLSLHRFITVAALVTGAAQVIFLFNLFRSMFAGQRAEANPWSATSLEWAAAATPPVERAATPVSHGPYEYGETSTERDFILQSEGAEVNLKQ